MNTTDKIMALADKYAFYVPGSVLADAARETLREAIEARVRDAERYQWLVAHPNEWGLYRKVGKHKLPFRMMRNGKPWGQAFATVHEAIDNAMKGKQS